VRRSSHSGTGGGTGHDAAPTAEKTEAAAVRLLARREHSTAELRRKLQSKGHAPEQVAAVVEKLAAKRLVSDDRFLANFVDHHARRGQGPIRIRAELRQQGIAAERIEQELDRAAVDWAALAAQVRRRKFGAGLPRAAAERAKQARFLQYRGFDHEQIRAALRSEAASADEADDSPAAMDPAAMDLDDPDPESI
jgi:regulatory protein